LKCWRWWLSLPVLLFLHPHYATSSRASPLSGLTGSSATQESISVLSHIDLPPTMRERGNLPARIQLQMVGNDTPAMVVTSRLPSSRTNGGGARAP